MSGRRHDLGHGLQLAAAVALSYLASEALGLPEGFWAVMSALIVSRPDTGATLAAGWDRVRGTALGTACGLAGVWLRHTGFGAPLPTLAIVAALAFASAGAPMLRSAPITALIVLSSGGIPGHSALRVAELRVVEIAIGVGVGLALSVALPQTRAGRRFGAECARTLREIAAVLDRGLDPQVRDTDQTALRPALRRLELLGESAARESRLSWGRVRRRPVVQEKPGAARIVMRLARDVATIHRAYGTHAGLQADPVWAELRAAAAVAFENVARQAEGGPRAEGSPLRAIERELAARPRGVPEEDLTLWLSGPVRWLHDDLRALAKALAAQD